MSEQAFGPKQDAEVQVTPIRRRSRSRKSVYSRPVDYSRIVPTALLLAALAAGALYYIYTNYVVVHAPYAVALNGQTLTVLRTRQDAVQAVTLLRAQYAPKLPGVVTFVEGEPLIRPYGKASGVISPDQASALLKKHLTPVYDGYAIFVNGKPLALLASKKAAWQTVSLMQQRGLAGRQGIPTFKQRVIINHLRVDVAKGESLIKLPPAGAAAELVHPPRPRVYTVELGDNFWKIATDNGITVDDLVALNPGLDYRALHKGDQVKLPDEPSPVTIAVRVLVRTEEPITAAPPDASQPSAPPAPANSKASAENRAPVTTGGATTKNSTPSSDGTTTVTPRPRRKSTVGDRTPTAHHRSSTRRRTSAMNNEPSSAPPPRSTRPRTSVRRPPTPSPAVKPDTTTVPKSYTEHRMALKKKSTPTAEPAPAGNGN